MTYKPGQSITHPQFGHGHILSASGSIVRCDFPQFLVVKTLAVGSQRCPYPRCVCVDFHEENHDFAIPQWV